MLYPLEDRLFRRELDSGKSRFTSLRGIYGDRHWVDNLDIVNELGGHHGCVNALSWSKNGRLLASGSDDTNILLHAYQPDQSASPFSLTTSIATGHTANIFSVKFMPHSNDNTLVSAAGDCEVRVFDIEYSGRTRASSITNNPTFMGNTGIGTKYLSQESTNGRVYRSHSDRVKRIVTESSPHLFLSCSEDGEVRQWDLRLPSSSYPRPRGGSGFSTQDDSNVPPPLITYKRYRLDLNTISCSASQPHYIVLGGAHLHCFLHDRRMLGRDLNDERGSSMSPSNLDSDLDEDKMGAATRCVRRFAPNGKKKMGTNSNGHVTACKISDARPNEMVASWSGDHIYSFDLIRSPDAREPQVKTQTRKEISFPTKTSGVRKRKRPQLSESHEALASRPRPSSDEGDMALRVRYENGQSEDIALPNPIPTTTVERVRDSMLTPAQKKSISIARRTVKIRKLIFSLERLEETDDSQIPTAPFKSALKIAEQTLQEIDSVSRSWRYPVDPTGEEIMVHRELRRDRDRTRRFVQATAVLCRTMGASSRPQSNHLIDRVKSPSTEGPFELKDEIFMYDFLKAIFAWLEGGVPALHKAFQHTPQTRRVGPRYPIPPSTSPEAVHEYLVPYLMRGAGQSPISNVDASRFELDENRLLFSSQQQAVFAFSEAIKVPLVTGTNTEFVFGAHTDTYKAQHPNWQPVTDLQPLRVVRRYWGLKVTRGLLLSAGEGINFSTVDHAFGGLGVNPDSASEREQSEIDPEEEDLLVDRFHVGRYGSTTRDRKYTATGQMPSSAPSAVSAATSASASTSTTAASGSTATATAATLEHATQLEPDPEVTRDDQEAENEDEDEDQDEDEDEDEPERVIVEEDDDDSQSDESDSDDQAVDNSRILFRTPIERAKLRVNVDTETPVSSHTRTYQGHCNVKTVKDVNYYGLDDEYVVSGSDDGRLFIWDRKSSKLVNILEGDGEVVNVIQGHPYEPMMAASGIDHTIKIFSSDSRAQRDARLGLRLGITSNRSSGRSTLRGSRWRRQRQEDMARDNTGGRDPASEEPLLAESSSSPGRATHNHAENSDDEAVADELEGYQDTGGWGLTSRRQMQRQDQITAHNDIERQSGQRDAFITRSMLAQLAAHMRERRADVGVETDGDGHTIVVDDDCSIM